MDTIIIFFHKWENWGIGILFFGDKKEECLWEISGEKKYVHRAEFVVVVYFVGFVWIEKYPKNPTGPKWKGHDL